MLKRVLFALIILTSSFALGQDSFFYYTGTATGSGTGVKWQGTGMSFAKLTWTKTGTVTVCSVKVEQSSDNSSWSDLIAAQDCSVDGSSYITAAITNYVRITFSGTFTGTGSVYAVGTGYINNPGSNGAYLVSSYSGATLGDKIIACFAALPTTGGVCDARNITGAQSIVSNIFSGMTKPVVLLFGSTTITDSSCWIIPNDGATPPMQSAIHIIGVGIDAGSMSAGKTPVSGTIIDNSCSSGIAKVDTRGQGVIEMEGITWRDTSGGTLPFFQTTNTIAKIHDNQWYGSKNGLLCDQDAIILGGTTTNLDGSSTAAFQGYGTYVTHNFFNHIRRAVYGRTFANGLSIKDNVVWAQSGSNLVGGAAIEFTGGTSTNVGNDIAGNVLEISNYPYGIKFSASGYYNSIRANSFYDPSATFLAGVRFESASQYNYVEDGYTPDPYTIMSEGGGITNTNTLVTSHTGQVTKFMQGIAVANNVSYDTYNASGTKVQMLKEKVDNNLYLGNSEEVVLNSTTFSYAGTNIRVPTTGVFQFSTDTGISRTAAAGVAFGNGTSGDTTATLKAQTLWLQGSSVGGTTLNFNNNGIGLGSSAVAGWTSGAAQGNNDTAISRLSPALIAIGNGTAGNSSGAAIGGMGIALTSQATITAGAAVKIDTANNSSAVLCAITDTTGCFGFAQNAANAASTVYVLTSGSIATPLLGTGTCTKGQFVIADTTTAGRVKCTSAYTAGTVLGFVTIAQAVVGSAVGVVIQVR